MFSLELIERLQDEGHTIDPGSAGENLTLAGLEWEKVGPGALLNILAFEPNPTLQGIFSISPSAGRMWIQS